MKGTTLKKDCATVSFLNWQLCAVLNLKEKGLSLVPSIAILTKEDILHIQKQR